MSSRYEPMKHLRDDLEELFQLCGVQGEPIKIAAAPALIRLAEGVVRDSTLNSYLTELDMRAEQAIRALKERKLDEWNNQQNEIRIVELERALERERQAGAEREAQHRRERLSAIQDLIALRDKLLLRQSWLEERGAEEEAARKLAVSQLRETARCLSSLGVEMIEEAGAFHCQYQSVVETRPAETPEQVDQVAETVRPGYRLGDEVLRPQEVILFAAE